MEISIVVPVFNEGLNPLKLYNEACNVFKGTDLEVIFCDDASTDNGLSCVSGIENVRVVRSNIHIGQDRITYRGMVSAKYKYIGVLDCDLQDSLVTLKILFKNLLYYNADCSLGVRKYRDDNLSIRITSSLYYTLLSIISGKRIRNSGNFFCVKSSIVKELDENYLRGSLQLNKYRCYSYWYLRSKREYGKSHYNWARRIKLGTYGIKNAINSRRKNE